MGLGAQGGTDGGLGAMRPHATTEGDNTPEVTPKPRAMASWRVSHVEVLPGFCLRVRFNDGTEGAVEMAELINYPVAGVFAGLRYENRFRLARVALGAVMWPGDLDL